MAKKSDAVIYQAKNGAIELRADLRAETVWATQKEIAQIFGVTPQNVTIHLRRIYADGELGENTTCKESLQVQKEGGRQVRRKVKEYNLDAHDRSEMPSGGWNKKKVELAASELSAARGKGRTPSVFCY